MKYTLPFRNTPLVLAITASLVSPIWVQAAPGDPLGPEFRVNTYTTNHQGGSAVAMDADGDFVVAWESYGQDGSRDGIYAQRYNRAGMPQGPEFQVNTFTTHHQWKPTVAMDAEGDFVVAWESGSQDGSGYGIYAQRYNRAGVPQGPEFRVNTSTTNDQRFPAVAMDADGDFVVTWRNTDRKGSYYYDFNIYAQRYDRAGVAQGPEFRVNTYITLDQDLPAVAMNADGDFVVAWESRFQDGSGLGIYAQRYTQAGVAQGAEFQVNTYTTGHQGGSAVAMDADGDFVVAWESYGQDGSWEGIYAQRYTRTGVAQGAEFRVNTFTTNSQGGPAGAMDADGDFVVAWSSSYFDSYYDGQDGSYGGIYAQRYAGPASEGTFTTVGLYDPTEGRFRLRTEHAGGRADYNFRFGPTDSSRLPVAGDWNGNGQTTIGLYDPGQGQFYLNNHLAWRRAEHRFRFGLQVADWIPIAGDWNGDGIATVGLYDPTHSKFFLRNSHTAGAADRAVRFGPGGFGWQPIAGDWDGDGRTTIGLYDPVTSRFYLRNRLAGGAADLSFRFGPSNSGRVPLAGDWDGDGVDTVGLYDPATSRFYLNNRHAGGAADISFRFGPGGFGWLPVTGQWGGQ